MSFATDRKQLTTALDRGGVRYALRFPQQKSGVLVVDLDPAAANLERARTALAAMPAKWHAFAAWLAAPTPQHTANNVLLTTTLAPAQVSARSDDEAALLAAIAESPDDDAPRLVYADLLTARGDPHGELIVLQCRQAAGDRSAKLANRIEAMLQTGWKAYAGELAPYAYAGVFRRGFVASVRMTVAAFAKRGERVFGAFPVRRLSIANDKLTAADVEKLAAAPALARVRELDIVQGYDVAHYPPLAPLAGTWMPALQSLELGGHGHSAADWTKLFSRLQAPALETLRILRTRTSAAIQEAIATNNAFSSLRSFHESVRESLDTRPRTREAYELLASRPLEQLMIEGNELVDDYALAPMFARDTSATLRVLIVSMTGVTNKLLHTIAASPKAKLLRHVEINDEGAVTIDGLRALLDAATNLETLSITSYEWTHEAIAEYEALLLAQPDRPLKRVALPRGHESMALEARFEVDAS